MPYSMTIHWSLFVPGAVFALPIIAGVVTESVREVPTRHASGRPQAPRLKI